MKWVVWGVLQALPYLNQEAKSAGSTGRDSQSQHPVGRTLVMGLHAWDRKRRRQANQDDGRDTIEEGTTAAELVAKAMMHAGIASGGHRTRTPTNWKQIALESGPPSGTKGPPKTSKRAGQTLWAAHHGRDPIGKLQI